MRDYWCISDRNSYFNIFFCCYCRSWYAVLYSSIKKSNNIKSKDLIWSPIYLIYLFLKFSFGSIYLYNKFINEINLSSMFYEKYGIILHKYLSQNRYSLSNIYIIIIYFRNYIFSCWRIIMFRCSVLCLLSYRICFKSCKIVEQKINICINK